MKEQERNAIITSIVFLVVGLGILWITSTQLGIEGEAVPVSMLLMPVLIYMIMSGRIKELRGPGGLEAVFNTPIDEVVETNLPIEDVLGTMDEVRKGSNIDLFNQLSSKDVNKPIYLSLKQGSYIKYSKSALQYYLNSLSRVRTFKFVIFLDQKDKYLGFMPHWTLTSILNGIDSNVDMAVEKGEKFLKVLNDPNRMNELVGLPEVVDELIYPDFTFSQALKKMKDLNIEALVVVNKDRTVKGLIERDQLISEMILSSQE